MARKTIVALFDSAQDADAARTLLRDAGIPDDDIEILRHSGFGAGSGHGEVVPRMTGWGVPFDEAETYAEGLRLGGTLLVVSVLDVESVERAVALIERGHTADTPHAAHPPEAVRPEPAGYPAKPVPDAMPAKPAPDAMPAKPAPDAMPAKPAPDAMPASPTVSDAAAARKAARTVEPDTSLSGAARAMREANAADSRRTAKAPRKPDAAKPDAAKRDVYVDRPGGKEERR